MISERSAFYYHHSFGTAGFISADNNVQFWYRYVAPSNRYMIRELPADDSNACDKQHIITKYVISAIQQYPKKECHLAGVVKSQSFGQREKSRWDAWIDCLSTSPEEGSWEVFGLLSGLCEPVEHPRAYKQHHYVLSRFRTINSIDDNNPQAGFWIAEISQKACLWRLYRV